MVAKIHYCKDIDLVWRRVKKGSGYDFVNKSGGAVPQTSKERFNNLRIPPAWKDVMVSPDPHCHIQAIGTDARGRKQYIYHPDWVKHNQTKKFDQMILFGEKLPDLRRAISAHMRDKKLTKERVTATIIWLLQKTFIRVGNKEYAEENQSYGLTTMREKHIQVKGDKMTFSFEGKSGVYHELDVSNSRVAKNVKECLDIPGYELFQYLNENQVKQVVDSDDVNEYLKAQTGSDFSAKDFRTWGGSVTAGDAFYKKGKAKNDLELKTKTVEVVTEVSEKLGNTKSVCKKYYIHPKIISSYEKDILVPHFARSYRSKHKGLNLSMEEYATWSLIRDS